MTRCRFEVVLAEALDRISRDQEDVASAFKRLAFVDDALWQAVKARQAE